jgi:3-methyladenine DNA glycosylase/8-oxoguanine DNA glycosylase
MAVDTVVPVAVRSLRQTLAAYRAGGGDPTTRLTDHSFLHATHTPDGPATLRLRWLRDPAPVDECGLVAEAWGPGRDWILGAVDELTGAADCPSDAMRRFDRAPLVVSRALRDTRTVHIGASRNLYHALLPTVIAQRITGHEAVRQWRRLCRALGTPAPGPADLTDDLLLPPSPETLRSRPSWWFHPLGIESKRACTLVDVARHHDKFWGWAADGSATAGHKLRLIRGVGPWTVGSVLGPALGDPDAVPVGDFHFPHIVAWNLAGEPRATDERMLALLAPYQGQRGRVLHALVRMGRGAPAFGPRRRTLAIQGL